MGESQAYFVGFKQFTSKAGKSFNVLSFLLVPQPNEAGTFCNAEIADIFVTPELYDTIVNSKKLMELVPIKYEIRGSKVYYSL